MVTRAISLLIIVGNIEALQTDENWATLIKHITENGALIWGGQVLHPRIKAPDCST